VVKLGWSLEENLICVLDDGVVMVVDVHCDIINTFSLGPVRSSAFAFQVLTVALGIPRFIRWRLLYLWSWTSCQNWRFLQFCCCFEH
jgi:hypothetical protein